MVVKSHLISNQIAVKSPTEAVIVLIKTTKLTEPLIVISLYRAPSVKSNERLDQMKYYVEMMDNIKTVSCAFKKGDRHLASNYRPISLTSVSCKLLEHIIFRHITNHMD